MFASFGFKFVSFTESNHGLLEPDRIAQVDQNSMGLALTNVELEPISNEHKQIVDLPIPTLVRGGDTPKTAGTEVIYGSNSFINKQIVIAFGYYGELDVEFNDVIQLYLHRTQGEDQRVAQIVADDYFKVRKTKLAVLRDKSVIRLMPGVHQIFDVDGDISWYFLSKTVF